MVEFNHGFIPWKSNQESFRVIWMFSLVVVFGMTLFSCQSTFSKEMIEQMKATSEVVMEYDKDTLDLAQLSDSISEMTRPDSLNPILSVNWEIIQPYDITGGPLITNDGMGLKIGATNWEITTCLIWNCSFTTSQKWTVVEKQSHLFLLGFFC